MCYWENKIKQEPYFKNAENWENVTNAMEMNQAKCIWWETPEGKIRRNQKWNSRGKKNDVE